MGGIFSSVNAVDERVQRALTIRDLEQEIYSLKADNKQLRSELTKHLHRRQTRAATKKPASEVSIIKVDEFVEQMLANPQSNLPFMPDFAERPLKRQALLYLLKAMATGIDTFKMEFLGHELVMHMQPIKVDEANEVTEEVEQRLKAPYSDYVDSDYSSGGDYDENVSIEYDASKIPL